MLKFTHSFPAAVKWKFNHHCHWYGHVNTNGTIIVRNLLPISDRIEMKVFHTAVKKLWSKTDIKKTKQCLVQQGSPKNPGNGWGVIAIVWRFTVCYSIIMSLFLFTTCNKWGMRDLTMDTLYDMYLWRWSRWLLTITTHFSQAALKPNGV